MKVSLSICPKYSDRQCISRSNCKLLHFASLAGSVPYVSDWCSGDHGFDPNWVWQYSFMEIDPEILSHSPFLLFMKFLVKECTQVLVNHLEY